jgi:benzoyl-CoA-dihydrodiol lyase
MDAELAARRGDWFVSEVVHLMKRVLKRMDVTSKSFFAVVDEGSCFAGSFLELALGADRTYMLASDKTVLAISEMNAGPLPMGNGLTRMASRFLANPAHAKELESRRGRLSAEDADAAGLVTAAVDPLDWEDEVRLSVEERASLSPDALTGMEASLRFAGPETLETKIFGRLSAWQNWIFQRPNAVGERGALHLYGRPESPQFDWNRT